MNRKKSLKISAILLLFFLFVLFIGIQILISDIESNLASSTLINRGQGWKENLSKYSGSEAQFLFKNSSKVSFSFETASKADQMVEIMIDKNIYRLSSPNINSQLLTIYVDKNKTHTASIKHICNYEKFPCEIKLTGLFIEKNATLLPYTPFKKTVSVLGDSISTIYGPENYTILLSQDLGYELHNASILGSTVSEVFGVDNAIKRYKRDLMSFKSDVIIIFLGTNDAAKNVPLNTFEKDYSKIASDIKKFNPDGKIFLVGILRGNDVDEGILHNYNNVIRSVAEKNNVYFIDPFYWLDKEDFSDDIHPSLESQKELAKHFRQSLFPILK